MIELIDVIALSTKHCKHPIRGKLAYATTDNFVGQILPGYHPEALEVCLMTPKAAHALCETQNHLSTQGLGLFIYDAYRPRRAVKYLMQWIEAPVISELELIQKAKHYPLVEKKDFVKLHYVGEDSGHCYGNTVDVVLFDLKKQHTLAMGSIYDFMDEKSHLITGPEIIGQEAYQRRQILLQAMTQQGFHSHSTEYWHFAHGGIEGREVKEPFDIEIKPELKGCGS